MMEHVSDPAEAVRLLAAKLNAYCPLADGRDDAPSRRPPSKQRRRPSPALRAIEEDRSLDARTVEVARRIVREGGGS